MTPYGASYAGEIRVSTPHPRSYGADVPLGHTRPRDPDHALTPNTAQDMQAYCRVHGIAKRGPWLCKAIPKPKGSPVTGSPTLYLAGQQEILP